VTSPLGEGFESHPDRRKVIFQNKAQFMAFSSKKRLRLEV
jgi:hypothetical protein